MPLKYGIRVSLSTRDATALLGIATTITTRSPVSFEFPAIENSDTNRVKPHVGGDVGDASLAHIKAIPPKQRPDPGLTSDLFKGRASRAGDMDAYVYYSMTLYLSTRGRIIVFDHLVLIRDRWLWNRVCRLVLLVLVHDRVYVEVL